MQSCPPIFCISLFQNPRFHVKNILDCCKGPVLLDIIKMMQGIRAMESRKNCRKLQVLSYILGYEELVSGSAFHCGFIQV